MATQERTTLGLPALPVVLGAVAAAVAGLASIAAGANADGDANGALIVLGVVLLLASAFAFLGLVVNAPNESRVLVLLGTYKGSLRKSGWWWVIPFTQRKRVSLRLRILDSDSLKVNDAMGNPVEIAAVITWQVHDTARAAFDVDDYEEFVRVQTEAAIRHVASAYPYDNWEDEDRPSLRANADSIMQTLTDELQGRLDAAGIVVVDSRLRRLAYAPEIAQEMLRRQQANAVVAARKLIVEGAVGMVDEALGMLSERQVVALDEERKAQMVSNLLVVLCSDRGAQPVVNSGSLYQ